MKKQVKTVKAAAKVAVASVPVNMTAQAAAILDADKGQTPLNVLAGKLKTTIGEATKLLKEYRANKTAKRIVAEVVAKGVKFITKEELAEETARTKSRQKDAPKTSVVKTLAGRGAKVPLTNAAPKAKEEPKKVYKKRNPRKFSKLGAAFAAELLAAGFSFVREQDNADGYVHADGRAALHIVSKKSERWQVKYPNGSTDEGDTAEELKGVLAMEKSTTTLADDIAKEKRSKSAPKVVVLDNNAVAPAVVRAVEMLGGMSLQRYNLDTMAGKKFDDQRAKLMTQLLGRAVKSSDAGVEALKLAFYTALAIPETHPNARQVEFVIAAKRVSVDSRKAKTAVKKAEQELIAKATRSTVAERTVPGIILPTTAHIGKKQRAKMDAQIVQQVLMESSTAEPIYAPHADAQVHIIPADIHLLEDPKNGLVMLQLEKANSQGAICVYNNGSRVAAGVVAPTTLNQLRRIESSKVSQGISSNEMILQAAQQLLSSAASGFPVTSVAQRHLTAVIHCKDLVPVAKPTTSKEDDNDMADEKNGNKKFASPKSKAASAKKSEKPAKKAAAKKESNGEVGRRSKFTEDQSIVKKFKDGDEHPYRAGTARFELLNAAAKAGTVGKYLKAAGEPSGGSPTSYLNLFVKEGHLVVK